MAEVFSHALMISGFVFVMMLLIEYTNILTSGKWQQKLARRQWGQYLLAAFLGALPGCLGAFMVVAMFSHRMLSTGAVVAAMIATSGDEAYVMLAMIPKQALVLMFVLPTIGVVAGIITDRLSGRQLATAGENCEGFNIHPSEQCRCFSHGQIVQQWKNLSAIRGILFTGLAIYFIFIISGQLGPPTWNWMRTTIVISALTVLFFVATAPEHFLEEHLWNHVSRQHLPRIFLWTFATLLLIHVLTTVLHLEGIFRENQWIILAVACLIGLIPESGPHLVFVTLYAGGNIPLSILLASSIVQDGHGMLPMLAHSRQVFLYVKLINLIAGLLAGALAMTLGF